MSWAKQQKFLFVGKYYENKSLKMTNQDKGKFDFKSFSNRDRIFELVKNFEAHENCDVSFSPSGFYDKSNIKD